LPYRDLREFLALLEKRGELKVCEKEVDTRIEIAKVTDKSSKMEGPAILFKNVKGFSTPVVTGLFGTLDRGFLMIESTKYDGFKKLARGLEKPIPVKIVRDGPCKEIVKSGNDVNLHEIPVLWHHDKDSHYFITCATCQVRDPDNGISNSSINRIAVQGKNRLTIQTNPPHQLGIIISKYLAQGKPCPVVMAVGTDPAILIASVSGIPPSVDELEVAGGIRGAPVEMVKCETSDLEAPATAELVIEGEIIPGDEEGNVGRTEYDDECPFGEIHGYFGARHRSPVIYVRAITHRSDYIYHAAGTAEPPSEHQIFDAVGMQGDVYSIIKNAISTEHIGAINAGSWAAIISIKKTRAAQARELIYALLAKPSLKRVTIVDADIDVFKPTEVEWAIQFRSCADDYILTSELAGMEHDPMSSPPYNFIRKVGIDATLPIRGDKRGKVEVLRDLGPARYSDLDKIKLEDYLVP